MKSQKNAEFPPANSIGNALRPHLAAALVFFLSDKGGNHACAIQDDIERPLEVAMN